MGISYLNGNVVAFSSNNNNNILYSAAAGNIVFVFLGLFSSPGGAVTCTDNNSVSLTPLTNANNAEYLYGFYYTVPAGGNGGFFSCSWTTPRVSSVVVLEYQVSGGTMAVSATNIQTNTGSSGDPTISLTLKNANDFMVAAFVGPQTLETSWTSGNERQYAITLGARVSAGDNTAASATSVTCTGGVSLATWAGIAGEIIFTPSSSAVVASPNSLMMMGAGT